jgi:prepilin-type N-terminal cleavage/methylation domain-containing protein
MQRGFTLIELSYVLAVLGVLAAITVPTYDLLLRRAHAAEAPAMMHAIAHAELQRLRDGGEYLACPATGDVPRAPVPFTDAACWSALGIRPEGPVRFRYGVALEDGGYVVTAEGDLDRDGETSLYTLRGEDLVVVVERRLE